MLEEDSRRYGAFSGDPRALTALIGLGLPPRLLQGVCHLLQQSKGHLLGLGGLAEEQEGRERLVADVPGLEDGQHLQRQKEHGAARPAAPRVRS